MPIELNKISYTLDFSDEFDENTKLKDKQAALREIGETVIDEIFETSASEKSSVNGKSWDKLSDDYKAKKKKLTGSGKADLLLSGGMLTNLKFEVKNNMVTWKITDKNEKKKAHGHNTGGGNLPPRKFLPDDGGSAQKLGKASKNSQFNSGINQSIRNILKGK